MYLTHNEGKSLVDKRYIKTLKYKIYKHMTAASKNVYFCVFDDIVDKYIEQLKVYWFKFGSHVEYSVDSNAKNAKYKIGDCVKISKYKNIVAEGYTPSWSEEVLCD